VNTPLPAIRNLRILYPEDIGEQTRIVDEVKRRLQEASSLREKAEAITKTLPRFPEANG
jgi:hypothetical protein